MSCSIYQPSPSIRTFDLSMESVEFQPAREREQIIELFHAVIDEVKDTRGHYMGGPATKAIEDWVYDRMKLRIHLVMDGALAACLPLYSSDTHALANPFWHGSEVDSAQSKWKRDSDGKRGWVDLRHAQVGGVFSTYDHPVHIRFTDLLGLKLSVAEIAAVFMHEIGHLFTWCEYSARLSTANQVLEQISKEVTGTRKNRSDYIFKLVSDVHKEVNPKDLDLLLSEDQLIAGTAYRSLVVGMLSSVVRDLRYSETSSEQLADSFAVRWGFGRELVTALDTMLTRFGDPAKSTSSLWLISIIQIAMATMYGALLLVTLPMAVGIPAAAAVTLLFAICFDGELNYRTYDNLRDRFKRIRQDIIAGLKRQDLGKAEVENALKSLDDIDDILKDTGTGETAITRIMRYFAPWSRRTANSREELQLFESLANNELFAASQRIKHA